VWAGRLDRPLRVAYDPRDLSKVFRRAAPARRLGVTAAPRTALSLGKPKTPIQRDYPALARHILAHPDWTVAAALPEIRRGRVLARLVDAALASSLSGSSAQLQAVQ